MSLDRLTWHSAFILMIMYHLGSTPNDGAIREYSDIRDSSYLLVKDIMVVSGTTLFASVIGR